MAQSSRYQGAVVTLVLFISSGVLLAEEEVTAVGSGGDDKAGTAKPTNTVRPTPSVTSNISNQYNSSDNSAYHSAQPDKQDANTLTKQGNNDTESVTEIPSAQETSSKAVSGEKDKDTTQVTTLNEDTTHQPPTQIDVTDDLSNKPEPSSVETTTKGKNGNDKGHTQSGSDTTTQFIPVTFDTRWMDTFIHTHHFEGQYLFSNVRYLFDFVVRYKHPNDPKTLVTNFYDADGAVLEFNGTSADGNLIVLTLSKIFTPGVRFPLHEPLEIMGSFSRTDQPYFTANFTKPINSSFSWLHMNKGLGAIETGETAGTRTAIVIIIPTSIAFLGICGTVAIVCWASKKGYLRGRHKSYRLFTDAQVSYESEAETIHI